MNNTERKGCAAVSWLKNAKSTRKPYEDRYRLLSRDIPLVGRSGRGELFAVLDGIGGAPRGMQAAQAIADCLLDFYRKTEEIPADSNGLYHHLLYTNLVIRDWGCMEGTDRPLGGAAGTIAWIHDQHLTLFHAGDTAGMLLRQNQPPRVLTSPHEIDGGLYRYFGLGLGLEIEVKSERLEEGDLILMVSDGVTKAYSTAEAANIVQEIYAKTGDIGLAAQELVTRSRSKKSVDDITAMVIEVIDE
ncbi:MAG: protein serine/threonine phosphatase 2C family protein [Desulfuromonadales bacterium]|nr:protein serine/threonine phosphatase 2C family protein [Desulfuromonadales bacterium]